MNIKQNQMPIEEQRYVLRKFAESVAKPVCKFLEVGSWLGDSTIILAKVAQQHSGYLFCVDWWKGNIGTELMDIASKEDIFFCFWRRICREGLEDVVIPIRSKSGVASEVLKKHSFEMVFIDADHKYETMLRDIKQYAPLVNKKKGILCGHDCEGRISDFNRDFLKSGKDVDIYESVHCGAVLAVGYTFKDYSINYGIWSVRAKPHGWEPTNLRFPDIKDKRQPTPPPIGSTKNYDLFRYGKLIYAAPHSLGSFDVTNEKEQNLSKVVKADTLQKIEKLLGEKISFADYPILLESYKGYNFVQYRNCIFILSQSLGDINLAYENEASLKKYQQDKKCIISKGSLDEAKHLVDQLLYEVLQESLDERDKAIATLQADVSKRDEEIEALNREISDRDGNINKLDADIREFNKRIEALQSNISECDKAIETLNREISDRDKNIDKLNVDIKEFNKAISGLRSDVSAKDESIAKLSADIDERNKAIDSLRSDISARDENITKLNADIEKSNNSVDALQAAVSERDESIVALNNEISKREENIAKLNTEATEMSNYIKDLVEELADIKSTWHFRLFRWES